MQKQYAVPTSYYFYIGRRRLGEQPKCLIMSPEDVASGEVKVAKHCQAFQTASPFPFESFF